MLKPKIVVHSQRGDYGRNTGVVIGLQFPEGGFSYIKGPLPFEQLPYNEWIAAPTIGGALGNEFLQAALDCAWSMGMRPLNWTDERPGEIKAMDNHLQDMRRLVFEGPMRVAISETGK